MPVPTNFTIMKKKKEQWIDLISLSQRINICDDCGFVVIEDKTLICEEMYLYNLRIALRSLGHKITKILKFWDKNEDLDLIAYKTTITKDEFTIAMKWFDDYTQEVYEDRYESEIEDEESEDEENPSV